MRRADAWEVIEALMRIQVYPKVRPWRKYQDPPSMGHDEVALEFYVPYFGSDDKRAKIKDLCERRNVQVLYEETRYVKGNARATIR